MSQNQANQAVDNTPEDSAVDDIAQALITGMPEVQQHAIDQHNEAQAELQEKQNVTDKAGNTFNPDIHATNEDGSPRLTESGNFAKKRGRKSGSTNSGGSTLGATKSQIDPATIQKQQIVAKQQAAGKAAAGSLIMLGMVIGGDEWRPLVNEQMGLNEQANLEQAFADYFTARGLDDIPAGVALSIAVSAYVLPRFTMPKTRTRTATLWTKVKMWWANRKLKKHGLEAKELEAKDKATKAES